MRIEVDCFPELKCSLSKTYYSADIKFCKDFFLVRFLSFKIISFGGVNTSTMKEQPDYTLTCYKLVVLGMQVSRLHRTTER
jgi:hypothetical protein